MGRRSSSPPEPPEPPDSIPTYVREGLDRQDPSTLRDVARYCEDRLEYLEREVATAELADSDEELVDVDGSGERGTVVTKLVPCGKDCGGCPHGPYRYRVTRRGESLHWEYLGRVDDVDGANDVDSPDDADEG